MAVLSPRIARSPAPAAKSGRDRRRAPRFKRDSAAQLIFWPASSRTAALDVRLVDYSRTGVGVLNHEAIRIGQKFVLREPFVTRGSTCIYTVVRCDQRGDGYFSIGLLATSADETPPAPEPVDDGQWMEVAYFAFALIGAIAIVAMALLHR
jgi:hypothetical protein